jgi:hypothetical protein
MSSQQPTVKDSSPPRETQDSLVHTEESNLFSLPQSEDRGEKSMAMKDTGQQPLPPQGQVRIIVNSFDVYLLIIYVLPPSLSVSVSLSLPPSLPPSLHPGFHMNTHTVSVGLGGQARTATEPTQARKLTAAEGAYRTIETTPNSDYE